MRSFFDHPLVMGSVATALTLAFLAGCGAILAECSRHNCADAMLPPNGSCPGVGQQIEAKDGARVCVCRRAP